MNYLSEVVGEVLQNVCAGERLFSFQNILLGQLLLEALSPKEAVTDPVKVLYGIEDNRAIAIPVTGGLDSTVVYFRTVLEGKASPRCYYFDMGQPYIRKELAALKQLEMPWEMMVGPQLNSTWSHVIPGRNLYILARIAEELSEGGTILFGAVNGEIVDSGGDKSVKFFRLVSDIFSRLPRCVRLEVPLALETKADMVRWWLEKLPEDKLQLTVSCFSSEVGHCGYCLACLRKALAFAYNDIMLLTHTPVSVGCASDIRRLDIEMTRALSTHDFSVFSKRRCEQDLRGLDIIMRRGW